MQGQPSTTFRFTLPQLFKAVTLIAILLSFTQAHGCGEPFQRVTRVVFSPDGSTVVATVYSGRDANVRFKAYVADVTRTVELHSVNGTATILNPAQSRRKIVDEQFKGGTLGPFRSAVKDICATFDHDGHTMAVLSWDDDTVTLWDLHTSVAKPWGQAPAAAGIALSPDGTMLAIGNWNESTLWDLPTKRLLYRFPLSGVGFLAAPSLAFSPDGKTLAIGAERAELRDVNTGALINTITVQSGFDCLVRFSPDGKLLAVAGRYEVQLFDLPNMQQHASAPAHWTTDIAFAPDGKSLVLTSNAGDLGWLHAQTGKLTMRTPPHASRFYPPATTVAYSPDGRLLATGDHTGNVLLWDVHTLTPVATLRTPRRSYAFPWILPATLLFLWFAFVWPLPHALRAMRTDIQW